MAVGAPAAAVEAGWHRRPRPRPPGARVPRRLLLLPLVLLGLVGGSGIAGAAFVGPASDASDAGRTLRVLHHPGRRSMDTGGDGHVPAATTRRSAPWSLAATDARADDPSTDNSRGTGVAAEEEVEREPLSDLDARVLRSLLEEKGEAALGLGTEEGIRQLLERGVAMDRARRAPAAGGDVESTETANAKYASTVLQTLGDTRLWRKLSAQADDWFGSLQLWVGNKVEQDLKVVAALGLFTWDRIQRDVARALPAAASVVAPRQLQLLLGNSSSYREPSASGMTLRDALATPSDEIRSVTRAVWDILSGQAATPAAARARSLRTAAPAGTAAVADRQRRAFRQRSRLRQQTAAAVVRLPAAAADAAWELRRELAAESGQRPGYRTEPIRTALAAGVAKTGQYLKAAAAQRQQLRAARRAALRSARTTEAAALRERVLEQRAVVLKRVRGCIEAPELTWLSADVLAATTLDDGLKLDSGALQQLVTRMICIRDDMDQRQGVADVASSNITDDGEDSRTFASCIQELKEIRDQIIELRYWTSEAISGTIADTLFNEILSINQELENANEPAIMLQLDELQATYNDLRSSMVDVDVDTEIAELEGTLEDQEPFVVSSFDEAIAGTKSDKAVWFADEGSASLEDDEDFDVEPVSAVPTYVDVVPEALDPLESYTVPSIAVEVLDDEAGQSVTQGLVAEIVSDEDFDAAFDQARVATAADAGDDGEEEGATSNPVVDLSLRALDVVFFVLEKAFTVVVPNTLRIGKTVLTRIQDDQRSRNGSPGWERIRNAVDAKSRY